MTPDDIVLTDSTPKKLRRPRHDSTIASVVATSLVRFLDARNVNGAAVLNRAGLNLTSLDDKYSYIALGALAKALEVAAIEMDDSLAGLRFGEWYRPPVRNACYYAMSSAPNMRSALISLASHRNNVINIPTRFADRGAMAEFIWTFEKPVSAPRHITDFIAMRTLRHIQTVTDSDWLPMAVGLTFEQPDDCADYYRLLGQDVRFGQSVNSFLIGPDTLARPMPNADPDLYQVARNSFLRPRLGKPDDNDPVDRVRRYIGERIENNGGTLKGAAKHMGLTEHQLRRVLKQSDTCFQCLLDETRKTVSEHYLIYSDMRFSEIAFMLGFSDQSAFTRAVKRWFGATPKQMRRDRG